MGINVYLSWAGQTLEEQAAQEDAYLALDGGSVGYLRESYTGGPYVTKILVRNAFESARRQAQIPACVLRERLQASLSPCMAWTPETWRPEKSRMHWRSQGPACRTHGRLAPPR